jgi:ribonucleoside-diphosphate reductase alpha chain
VTNRVGKPKPFNRAPFNITVDDSRDALLTDFGKETLKDRYLLPNESYQQMFARVASAYADDQKHAQRLYDYISQLWFMPATPVLSNGGTGRGLPISCFLNAADDSLEDILGVWNENVWLASNGGGIGTYWGGVRSIGEAVGEAGQTSGVIPFIKIMDAMTLGISQGSLRRGSAAVYMDIDHPEIIEFIELRKPTGDMNRRSLNLHHGVCLTDEFMLAVKHGNPFDLKSPRTGEVIKTVDARTVWQLLLETRVQTGEPYILFSDTVNKAMPQHQRDLGLKVKQSNLCVEIMLATGKDHLGKDRTAVCCLSSVNAEKFLEWRREASFIEDIMRFLDNVLQDFIDRAPDTMSRAIYAAQRERSVGLGLMGFHSFLQSQGIAFESNSAKSWNMAMFKYLRREADKASVVLAEERGPCPDAEDRGVMERFSHKLAIAPTASISIICGGASAGIDPIPANIYTQKTLSGTFTVQNQYLKGTLKRLNKDTKEVWDSILENGGSVQHLTFLNDEEKSIYKTSFELNQYWVIEHAADRTPEICQSQSLNIFVPADIHKKDLHRLHFGAWEKGVKSLYYTRSMSVQRAAFAGKIEEVKANDDECLACQ